MVCLEILEIVFFIVHHLNIIIFLKYQNVLYFIGIEI